MSAEEDFFRNVYSQEKFIPRKDYRKVIVYIYIYIYTHTLPLQKCCVDCSKTAAIVNDFYQKYKLPSLFPLTVKVLRENGHSFPEIAKVVGCQYSTCIRIFN